MLRKGFIAILFTLLLTACGQGMDSNDTVDENDINATTTETEETSSNNVNNNNADTSNETNETDSEESADNNPEQAEGNSNDNSEDDKDTAGPETDLKVHYMDVGQADATLFQFDNYTILFDTGDWNQNDVINYLDAQDVTNIDLIVISHPHADHIGQLEDIMHTYNVDEVWFNGDEASSHTFQDALTAVLESEADFEEPKTGEEMQIGPMDIEVLHPKTNSGHEDLNRDSLSLRFSYGDISFVFTGDAYKEDEHTMMSNTKTVEGDILQLGHHGSNTSSDPDFIDAVNPDVAIYSAGEDNSYGHPSPETVSLIQDEDIDLYGTDVHGTILVTTDGKTYDIETKEDGTITPSSSGVAEDASKNNADEGDKQEESQSDTASANDDCVSINDASSEELQEIIHIGPKRAEDVIQARPFNSVDDLTKVNGIGPARIDDINDQGLACTGE